MSTIHRGLTVTVVVEEQMLEEINALLMEFNQHAKNNQAQYRENMPSTYFISWLTLPKQVYAKGVILPARILLMTSFVGNKKQHILELANFLGQRIQAVFEYSEEFPPTVSNLADLISFIRKKTVFQAFYSGFKFIPPQEVSREQKIKERVFEYLDQKREYPGFTNLSPAKIKTEIEDFIKKQVEFGWVRQGTESKKIDTFSMLLPLGVFLFLMGCSLICLILSIFLAPAALFWIGLIFPAFLVALGVLFLWLRINENNPHIANEPASDGWIRQIIEREKNSVLNEMTVISPLKKGLIRRIFLGLSLRLITLVGYFSYIPTVHTARWLQLDGGKRLVFIANFDNISEAYAHDFVDSDNRSRNMAVVFSHAAGFPATTWLVKRGYNHRSQYMNGVRVHQKITQFWYAFNTDLSVENLKNNHKFREGLFKKMDEDEIREWLLTI